jgi:hypothetical protein
MLLQIISCAPTAVDADGVCQSQSPGAGAITINGALSSGGVATFNAAQLVRLTSAGNDSGITFTFNGTDAQGNSQSETVAGTNASNSDTTKFFKTVTSITKSGATAGAIVVGNLITSVSPYLRTNLRHTPFNIGFGCVITGTSATYTVQHTFNNTPFSDPTYPANWFDHESVTGKSADDDGNYAFPVTGIRIKVTASTSGTVTGTFVQAGV